MSRIKIKNYREPHYLINLLNLSFSLASSPKEGRKQCTQFTTCKAFLHDAIRTHVIKGGGCYGYIAEKDYPIDMNKLRLLIGADLISDHLVETFKKKLYSAKKVVNFYEEVAGWTKSRIVRVDHSTYDNVWLLTGPKEWMQAPQLISMVTLVLRVGTLNGVIEFKTNEDIEKTYKGWVTSEESVWDKHYLGDCWDKLFLVAKHNKELFDGISLKELYPSSCHGSFHENGIARLCSLRCDVTPELNDRLKKICEREGVKIAEKKPYSW